MTRPTLLFHVQHFLGMGHLVRAFALAEALKSRFHVVIASGGHVPEGLTTTAGVEVVALPALGFDHDRQLVSLEPHLPVESVLAERTRALAALCDRLEPDVVLVELYPFGRKKLAAELETMIDRARLRRPTCVVATSVRDILVTGRHDQQRHDDRALSRLEHHFDVVLVHGDPGFTTLDVSFRPRGELSCRVEYTGFVGPRAARRVASPLDVPFVLVSAGGGWVGGSLMRAAIEASTSIHDRHGLATMLVTGPLAHTSERRELAELATCKPVHIVGSVPQLLPTMEHAAVSVSQAGYNTVMDVLAVGLPAVVVPYGDARENEQIQRAHHLAEHGVATLVRPSDLSADALARAVSNALTSPPVRPGWDLDGAERSAEVLASLVPSSLVASR